MNEKAPRPEGLSHEQLAMLKQLAMDALKDERESLEQNPDALGRRDRTIAEGEARN